MIPLLRAPLEPRSSSGLARPTSLPNPLSDPERGHQGAVPSPHRRGLGRGPNYFTDVQALLLALLLLAQLACNSAATGSQDASPATNGPSASTGAASNEASVASTAANTLVTITAQVPTTDDECDCHTPPIARLVSALKDAHLDEGFKEVSTVDAAQVFSLTFDTQKVPAERVEDLIKSHGGTILRGPAPAQEVYSSCQCGLGQSP